MAEDDVRVPAGWYPDPLGLPQLRWWDNHAWTEHTSDARQPMVQQETRTATRLEYADPFADEAPLRVQPATDDSADALFGAPERPHADPVRSLEAPVRDEIPAASAETAAPAAAAPATAAPASAASADAPASAAYNLDTRFDDLLGAQSTPRTASSHLGDQAASYVPEPAAEPVVDRASRRDSRRLETRNPYYEEGPRHVNTGPAWMIALMPIGLLLAGLLYLLSGMASGSSMLYMVAVIAVPYLLVVAMAYADRRALIANGIEAPAHWAWAFLTAPAYLVARMRSTVRETGRGFGPVVTWFSMTALLGLSVVSVPGLVIAVAPQVFSAEAAASVETNATALGANLSVECPPIPPMLPSQSFTCSAINDSGQRYNVQVSLQRANGWISWRVDNWGINYMSNNTPS